MQHQLHANEQGPVFVTAKPYFWQLNEAGRLTLQPWPMTTDGDPVPDPRGEAT